MYRLYLRFLFRPVYCCRPESQEEHTVNPTSIPSFIYLFFRSKTVYKCRVVVQLFFLTVSFMPLPWRSAWSLGFLFLSDTFQLLRQAPRVDLSRQSPQHRHTPLVFFRGAICFCVCVCVCVCVLYVCVFVSLCVCARVASFFDVMRASGRVPGRSPGILPTLPCACSRPIAHWRHGTAMEVLSIHIVMYSSSIVNIVLVNGFHVNAL